MPLKLHIHPCRKAIHRCEAASIERCLDLKRSSLSLQDMGRVLPGIMEKALPHEVLRDLQVSVRRGEEVEEVLISRYERPFISITN